MNRMKLEDRTYESAMKYWRGRIDSEVDYDAFRWNQWVKPLDLEKDEENIFDGELGFAFIGFCSDQGVYRNQGRVGTAAAPNYIRKQMATLPCNFCQKVKLYDAGNILCYDISLEEGQKLLGEAVAYIEKLNLFPIILGGGHETTYGHYLGQKKYLLEEEGKGEIGIINFDAHFDMRPYELGNSSGTMFRQIADECEQAGYKFSYMPLGIQLHSNTVSLFKEADHLGVDYILAKQIQEGSLTTILDRIDAFLYKNKDVYITICADVFSAAFAPGVSATQALGLDPERVLPVLKHIIKTNKVRGFDICEVSPRFDQDNTTAKLASVLVFAVINTLCTGKGLVVLKKDGWFE